MADHVLNARKRALSTKGALTKLRSEGKVPGIFYIKGSDPISVEVNVNDINSYVFTSETHIITLKIDGEKDLDCILKEIQLDPVTEKVVHFDLYGITKGQVMQVEIPIVYDGNAVGVKAGGKLQIDVHKLEIEVLPKDIPEHIKIDITSLDIGDSISVKDLSFDQFIILNNEDLQLVTVAVVHEEEEEEVEETEEETIESEETEPEVVKKGKDKEDQE